MMSSSPATAANADARKSTSMTTSRRRCAMRRRGSDCGRESPVAVDEATLSWIGK